jgi:hypothetical protein
MLSQIFCDFYFFDIFESCYRESYYRYKMKVITYTNKPENKKARLFESPGFNNLCKFTHMRKITHLYI